MPTPLEHLSDLLGFASGIALVVTAWRNDGLNGFIDRFRQSVDETKRAGVTPDKKAERVIQGLEQELTKWTWIDRWSLRAGAGLLVLSYALKVVHNITDW
jgi:hypothetical protein